MNLIDIMTDAWAIDQAKLNEITSIYDAHIKNEKIDLEAVEARIGKKMGVHEQGYYVIDGVAVIPVVGVIAKRANMFSNISGGASTELIKRDFDMAMDDEGVDSILFDIESPGGAVNGTQELAMEIFKERGDKPIVAYANGLMASAAYWFGSAADKIYGSATSNVGSIGVVAQHIDESKADKKRGIKRTEVFAGKYKRIASGVEGLSEEGKADMQGKVDYLYSIFVKDIASFRNADESTVINNMAEGRVFIGQQAVDAGLMDGIDSIENVIERMASGDLSNKKSEEIMMSKNEELTQEALAASHPELVAEIRAEGAKVELDRVKAVAAVLLPGHESIIESAMFDGKTTGAEAAIAVIKAQSEKGRSVLDAMKADAQTLVVDASIDDLESGDKGFKALVDDKMSADGITRGKATVLVAGEHPEAHAKYLKDLEV